jgi:hypothetical protein
VLFKQQFRLEVIELEAVAAYFVTVEEIHILISLPVTWAFQDGFDSLLRLRVLFGRFGLLPRQRFATVVGMGRRGNF